MKTFYLTFLSNLLFILTLHAQQGDYMCGARSAGQGGASVTLSDEWSMFNNIGGLARFDKKAVSTSVKNRYNMAAFTTVAIGFSNPIFGGTAAIGAFRFGDKTYNEQRFHLGYSYLLGIVSLGISVSYYQLSIEGLGSRKTPMIEFGGIAQLNEHFFFGAHISNIYQAKLSTVTGEKIPTIMKSGISFRPNVETLINMEVEKQVDKNTIIKIGLEYQLLEKLHLRTGFHTFPFESSFGLGCYPGNFKFDYAYSNHPQFKGIHEFSIAYQLRP